MTFVQVDIGVHTADAEEVAVQFSSGDARQAQLQSVPSADYVHYKVCFNACGTLDVLCKRVGGPR